MAGLSKPKTRGAFTARRSLCALDKIMLGLRDGASRVEPFWKFHDNDHLAFCDTIFACQQAQKGE